MPVPIEEYTVKIVWENNPDTPITSSALSKDFNYLATYQDFEFPATPPHRESTILMPDTDPLKLIMKRGTMFQIINEAEDPAGVPIIPVNSQYRIFDVGLEDLYLRVNDKDENDKTATGTVNWGSSEEWFVYICDKDDSTIYQEGLPDQYGGGAQFIISRDRSHPYGQVPGRANPSHINYNKSPYYTEKDTRMIGGFKSDSLGNIIPESIWDISGKYHTVRAKHYWVLDEFGTGPDNGRYIYRQIEVQDLNTTVDNVFDGNLIVHGDIVQDSGYSSFTGNVLIDGDVDIESTDILIDANDVHIGSRANTDIIHIGDFLNNSTDFEINTGTLDISAVTNFVTSAPTWNHGGDITIAGNVNQNSGVFNIDGNVDIDNTSTSITSTNIDSHGVWDHYGDFSIHSTVTIGSSGDPATVDIYSTLTHYGQTNIMGDFIQDNGDFSIDGNSLDITAPTTTSSSDWTHTGPMEVVGNFTQSGGTIELSGNLEVGSYLQVGRDAGSESILSVKSQATDASSIRSEADSGGLSYIYVGQDGLSEGGGMMFRGSPAAQQFLSTPISDAVVFYRTQQSNGAHYPVFSYPENSNNVTFTGSIIAGSGNVTANTLTVNTSITLAGAVITIEGI